MRELSELPLLMFLTKSCHILFHKREKRERERARESERETGNIFLKELCSDRCVNQFGKQSNMAAPELKEGRWIHFFTQKCTPTVATIAKEAVQAKKPPNK